MRIVDTVTKKEIANVTLFLETSELLELRDALNQLTDEEIAKNHYHIPSRNFEQEIIVVTYLPIEDL